MEMRPQLEHFQTVDAESEWRRGFGWFVRIQGIVTSLLADIGVTVALYFVAHWSIAVVTLVAGLAFVGALFVIRHFRLQRLHSDQSLHAFFHQSSDDIANIFNAEESNIYRERLDNFHVNTAQRIADFFRHRVNRGFTCCAIRIAEEVGEIKQYTTVARSGQMDASRAQNSKPIAADKGIAGTLLEYEHQGVIIIKDILEMENDSRWWGSKNDKLRDVRSLMAAPINGWENNTKVMLGILFVSSNKPGTLNAGHTLPVKAFADFLGTVYPSILDYQEGASDG